MKKSTVFNSLSVMGIGVVAILVIGLLFITSPNWLNANLATPSANVVGTSFPSATKQSTQSATSTDVGIKETVAAGATQERATSPIPSPIPQPTGIYENENIKAQWLKQGFEVQNAWAGLVDGNQIGIWAGAYASNPDQGVLQLIIILPYRTYQEEFVADGQHGALHITFEQNNRLILSATDQTTFYFDVPARRFVSSLNEIVPSAEPPPTYTPYAP
jgi:hypothetical protein